MLDFRNMSEEKLESFLPGSDEEDYAYRKEVKYRKWCVRMDCDPMEPDSRYAYEEVLEEIEGFWNGLDDNDRAGWTDNMNKD